MNEAWFAMLTVWLHVAFTGLLFMSVPVTVTLAVFGLGLMFEYDTVTDGTLPGLNGNSPLPDQE